LVSSLYLIRIRPQQTMAERTSVSVPRVDIIDDGGNGADSDSSMPDLIDEVPTSNSNTDNSDDNNSENEAGNPETYVESIALGTFETPVTTNATIVWTAIVDSSSSGVRGETKSNHSRGETNINHSTTNRDDLLRLPDHVFREKVAPFFGFKDYALASCAAQYLQTHWQAANRQKPWPLYVPEDCKTLIEAVRRVTQDSRITTIVLGTGRHVVEVLKIEDDKDEDKAKDKHEDEDEHEGETKSENNNENEYENENENENENECEKHENQDENKDEDEESSGNNTLEITSAMKIVGRPNVPKEEIVIMGGIEFKSVIRGNCHLQHLALCQAKENGVFGKSSFTMNDVLVEKCSGSGVGVHGTGAVGRCTNMEVRQCGMNGVVVSKGASITLIGAKTTVHHNCTTGNSHEYGLQVYGSSSNIQLVSPLTKEQVSLDNSGGGNWGAEEGADLNQIKTIFPATKMNDVNTNAVKLDAARLDAAYKRAAADGGVAKWHRSRLMIVGEGNSSI
jgi:hypothetical protein